MKEDSESIDKLPMLFWKLSSRIFGSTTAENWMYDCNEKSSYRKQHVVLRRLLCFFQRIYLSKPTQ